MLSLVWSNLADLEVLHLQLPVGRVAIHGRRDWPAAARIHLYRNRAGTGVFVDRSDRQLRTQFLVRAYGAHLPAIQISFLDSVFGALAGAGFFFVASGLYFIIRKRQGMGTGDFALMAMSGAFLGLKLTLLVIFLAPLIATAYALIRMVRSASSDGHPASLGEMLQTWEFLLASSSVRRHWRSHSLVKRHGGGMWASSSQLEKTLAAQALAGPFCLPLPAICLRWCLAWVR